MTWLSVQMNDSTVSRLGRLAERRKLSLAEMAALAIEEFIEREEWQFAEIEAAVCEADQGNFASDEGASQFYRSTPAICQPIRTTPRYNPDRSGKSAPPRVISAGRASS